MENVPGWGIRGLKLRDTKFQAWKLEALDHICPACYTLQNGFNTGTYTSLPLPAHLPEISVFNSNSWARYSFTGSLEVIHHPITIRLLGKSSGSLQLELNLGWYLWGLTSSWICWKRRLQNVHKLRKIDTPSSGQGEKFGNSNTRGKNKGTSLVTQMVKNPPAMQETRIRSLSREDPWTREWLPTLGFLPGKPHWQRSLVGYHPWGCKELDTTEWLTHSEEQIWLHIGSNLPALVAWA